LHFGNVAGPAPSTAGARTFSRIARTPRRRHDTDGGSGAAAWFE
jgi:hypothetical protein